MPLINSHYHPPAWTPGKHIQTIVPTLFRKIDCIDYKRERIATPDQDFLDLDWSCCGSSRLVILSHGLEGHSRQQYILGMVRALNANGWDALSWNFRSCSGELNNKVRFYHAGSTEDLDWVVQHALKTGQYKEVVLLGFSLGGSITLKLLGEWGKSAPVEISRGIAFSVPCDLRSCIEKLSSGFNRLIYLRRFMIVLKGKIALKIQQFPDLLSHIDLDQIQGFEDFDNIFTAPLCGFKDAFDYYETCSCKMKIPEIRVPTLLINAKNDPFLHENCHPIKECKQSQWVHLEQPNYGGHVGFLKNRVNGTYWSEQRALEFLKMAI